MKKYLRNLLFMLLIGVIGNTGVISVSASLNEEVEYVEVIVDRENLEEEIQLPPVFLNNISFYSTQVPSSSNIHNFSTNGSYLFKVNTSGTEIYSAKMFTGHKSNLAFSIQESSSAGRTYTVAIYEYSWGLTGTKVATATLKTGTTSIVSFKGIDTSKKFYFSLYSNNGPILINTNKGHLSTY